MDATKDESSLEWMHSHYWTISTRTSRVHVEPAVPMWHSGLTVKLSSDRERVQRAGISIMVGETEFNYEQTCALLGTKPLRIKK